VQVPELKAAGLIANSGNPAAHIGRQTANGFQESTEAILDSERFQDYRTLAECMRGRRSLMVASTW